MDDNLYELYTELVKSLNTSDTAPTIRIAFGHYLVKNIPQDKWTDEEKEYVKEATMAKLTT